MTSAALVLSLAVTLMAQEPGSRVQESELAPPGQVQVPPPPPPAAQSQPAQPPAPNPDPAPQTAQPSTPAQPQPAAEAQNIRRTREKPVAGRSVAAFWFVD